MCAASSVTPKLQHSCQGSESVFAPGLTDLFKTFGVIGTTAHAIHVLRNDRMVVARQLKPIQVDDAGIARCRSNPEADEAANGSAAWFFHRWKIAHDDVRVPESFHCLVALVEGITADCTLPLTMLSISIGNGRAEMEIFPTTVPASRDVRVSWQIIRELQPAVLDA